MTRRKPMTKEEYLVWKPKFDKASDAGTPWPNINDCRRADWLIEDEALSYLAKHLEAHINNRDLRIFVMKFFTIHFGSAEVDDYLMKISAYPDWM